MAIVPALGIKFVVMPVTEACTGFLPPSSHEEESRTWIAVPGMQTKFYVDRRILKTRDPANRESEAKATAKKKRQTKSLKETWQTLRESPKIMNLALLVVGYAVAHRLFEFAWKGQLRVLFPTAQAYSGALADVSIYTGASHTQCVFMRQCMHTKIFRHAKWLQYGLCAAPALSAA
jgi:ATP/ADP translocase